jgi:hypothetical protein
MLLRAERLRRDDKAVWAENAAYRSVLCSETRPYERLVPRRHLGNQMSYLSLPISIRNLDKDGLRDAF